MKCDKCGEEETEDNPVTRGPNPYLSDLYGDYTEYDLCDECREQLCDDI